MTTASCSDIQQQMVLALEEEVVRMAVEAHVAECPICWATWQDLIDVSSRLAEAADTHADITSAIAGEVQSESACLAEGVMNSIHGHRDSAMVGSILLPGERVGNWEVVGLGGRGGIATVYKALNPALKQHGAIKVLSPKAIQDEHAIERFRREAQVCASLDHPNIIKVFDFGVRNGSQYLVMQWVQGGSLQERVERQGPLPLNTFYRIARQCCSALHCAHTAGIVHRDIKPENVLLGGSGQVLLTDFGLAKSYSQKDASLTSPGMVMGTPAYMSPEQISGGSVGVASDIYSLGALFFFLLAGRPPYHGHSVLDTVRLATQASFPSITALRSDVPTGIEQLIQTMVARDPAERPETVEDVGRALAKIQKRSNLDAESPGHALTDAPSRRRWTSLAIIVGGASVGLLLAFLFWWILDGNAPQAAGMPTDGAGVEFSDNTRAIDNPELVVLTPEDPSAQPPEGNQSVSVPGTPTDDEQGENRSPNGRGRARRGEGDRTSRGSRGAPPWAGSGEQHASDRGR